MEVNALSLIGDYFAEIKEKFKLSPALHHHP